MIDIEEFRQRRSKLMHTMQHGVAFVPTAPEVTRNRDSHYPYRFDSYFYYLTGFTEPEAVVMLIAGKQPKSILFCREKNIEREIWDGFRCGPDAAVSLFGFDEAYPISRLEELAPSLLSGDAPLFYSLGADTSWDLRVTQWLNQLRTQVRSGLSAPTEIVDVRKLLDEMRLYKAAYEITAMQRAADISVTAHKRAMQSVRPGMMEYEIEAELLHEFYRQGSPSPAYTSIVAGGANACVLHYIANNEKLKDGDLLLIDAGCELDGYASDITRTFPVNGTFSSAQKDLYELVLAAQSAAIAKVKPGCHWNEPHEAALDVLIRGFIDFGLCQGSPESVLESGDYRRFYMHRTGHWLGLDVHDAGEYKTNQIAKANTALKPDQSASADNKPWRTLEPGMVLTVEPGCYVRPSDDVPEHFWNIGIRIEDDALVTVDGCDILTNAAPKTVADIEALMMRA